MKAADKLTKILEAIANGKTVTFSTSMRIVPVNAKAVAKFKKVGHDLFKVKGDSLFIARGKHYDCVDGCKVTVTV